MDLLLSAVGHGCDEELLEQIEEHIAQCPDRRVGSVPTGDGLEARANDIKWNPKKKGPLTRGFNALCLIAAYIFFMILPFYIMHTQGTRPYWLVSKAASVPPPPPPVGWFGR